MAQMTGAYRGFLSMNQSINSINQSIYQRQYMGWGFPDNPSQRLMYKMHDNKYTKSIKIQCI